MAKWQIKQKQTPEVIGKLEECFAIDSTIREACYYANISEATYYEWVKQDKGLQERLNRLRERPVLKARMRVVKWIGESFENALKYLKAKKKAEFSEQVKLEATVQGEMNYTVNAKVYENLNEKLKGKDLPDSSVNPF